MAANLPTNSDDNLPVAAINVTPFVDVVLVLLVIFMVTAPAMMKDVLSINLPKSASTDQKAVASLGIAVTKTGQVLFNGNVVTLETLAIEVKRAIANNPETQAIIAADEDSRHGDLVLVIDTIKSVGLNKFALQIKKQK